MASNGNHKKTVNTPGKKPDSGASQTPSPKPKSAVTIDLAATDITKSEAPGTSAPDSRGVPDPKSAPEQAASGAGVPKVATAPAKPAAFPVDPLPDKTSAEPGDPDEARAPEKTGENPSAGTAAKPPARAPESPARNKPDKDQQAGQGSGFYGLFPAIIGGFVAIFGLLGLQFAGIVPPMGGGDEPVLAELRERVLTLEKTPAPEIPDPAQIDALAMRVAAVEKTSEEALAAAEAAGSVGSPSSAFEERLLALEGAGAAPDAASGSSGDPAAIKALEQKIGSLEAGIAAVQETIGKEAAARQSVIQSVVEADEAAIAGIKAALAALAEKNDQVSSQITVLAEKVAASESALAERANAAALVSEIAKTVALDNLKQRAASGAPFADALSAVGKSGYPVERLAALEPYAASGLPAKQALDQTFERLIGTALAREGAPVSTEEGSTSALDKLVRNAMGLIGVRRVGGPDADNSPLGVLEAAYRASDVAAFSAALEKLNASQQGLFTKFLADWKAMVALEALSATSPNGSGQ